jgi:hypothetical protein
MSLFQSISLKKISHGPGDYVKGTWVEGPATVTDFLGTVQPPSGQTLRMFPEGKRQSDIIEVVAPIGIGFKAANPRTKESGDIIVWEGRNYQVTGAIKMDNGLLPHWELVASMDKEGEA